MGLFNFVSGFGVGLYLGLYVAKHYDVPDVPDPQTVYQKMLKILEDNKKDKWLNNVIKFIVYMWQLIGVVQLWLYDSVYCRILIE